MINFNYAHDEILITDKAKRIAKLLIRFSLKARREGILALEDVFYTEAAAGHLVDHGIDGTEENFFVSLFMMVIDGAGPECVESAARYFLNSVPSSEKELRFNLMLIAEGILMIQAGENSRFMAQVMSFMFGVEKCTELKNELQAEFDF